MEKAKRFLEYRNFFADLSDTAFDAYLRITYLVLPENTSGKNMYGYFFLIIFQKSVAV